MVLEVIILAGLFHHKHKPSPQHEDAVQKAWTEIIDEDKKIVLNAITGAQAFEKDARMAQYERPELDAFEQQIYSCTQDTDEHQFDKDVDTLIELGDKLMAVDKALEQQNII